MPRLLKNLKIKTIGSVDRPANGEAKVALMKRADGDESQGGGGEADGLKDKLEKLTSFVKGLFGGAKDYNQAQQAQAVEEKLWEKTRFLRESIESIMADATTADKQSAIANTLQQFYADLVSDMTGVQKAGRKISAQRIAQLKQQRDKLKETMENLTALIDSADVTPEPGEGELNKHEEGNELPIKYDDLPEEVRKAVEAVAPLQKKLEETEGINAELKKSLDETSTELSKTKSDLAKAQEELTKASDEKLTKEYIEKAKGYTHLGVKPEEFGPVLKRIGEGKATAEDLAKMEGVLKAANEAVEKGGLFGELGGSGSGGSDNPVTQFDAMVKGIIAKSAGMDYAQAVEKVAAENPALYAAYTQAVTVRV
ncbi:MAG: hypothetical protein WCT23_09360 [Candidatus Neomarinimicrobiota bacterium]